MNCNLVILVGRTTEKPEIKSIQSGKSVTSFSLATHRIWKDKQGKKNEDSEFHRIVAWGKTAELVAQYVEKGQIILIEGRLQTRIWEGKDGHKNYTTEVIAERVQFGPRPQASYTSSTGDAIARPQNDGKSPQERLDEETPTEEGDLPF